jgi:hypothetical protein
MGRRLFVPREFRESVPQIGAELVRLAGVQPDGRLVFCHCLVHSALVGQEVAKIIMGQGVVGPQPRSGAKHGLRSRPIVSPPDRLPY